MVSLYEALGVEQDAPAGEIRRAYRRAAKKAHPDGGGTSEAFAEITRAHAVLLDPVRRERYDRMGKIEDDQVDTLATRALQVIAGGFEAVLAAAGERDPAGLDWVAEIRARLVAAQNQGKVERIKAEAALKRLERLVGRFRVTGAGSENCLAGMVENRVARQREHLAAIDGQLEPLGLALEMLKRYSFDVERPPPYQAHQPGLGGLSFESGFGLGVGGGV